MATPLFHAKLTVQTQSHDYPIIITENSNVSSLESDAEDVVSNSAEKSSMASQIAPYIAGRQVLIVTNETVAPLYLKTLQEELEAQFTVKVCVLPDGEQYKNQTSINQIYDALMAEHFNRDVTLIALGGGVVGDMTGFAAASFMRGVNFIQIPTTLLSQVDSSVGGKTGINHAQGKNMIGAFWQPQMVLADMSTLKTLPARELSAGLAEVIKYALIMDADFLTWLEQHLPAMIAFDLAVLGEAVKRCCQYKADIVAQDERESGVRALLNFGHTFGHVIETHEGYGNWLHGEAVAAGMVQAAELSQKMGWLTSDDVARIKRVLVLANLPITPPAIDVQTALGLMGHDKKVKHGQIRLILLKSLGNAVLTNDFDAELLIEVLSQHH
ncbi:3-dehydroquinate synthase [Psychrobacter sp. ANT_WB68]|uniref:3-dehydroquinate synthase n=1 Tax=Psychrobacter sp. ANT_WB68 TaxID=2597355 RepID=UPI0011F3C20F|nr:3-dehydroquinate synthase [Psychrobacter sp. ANT_WB68]KAA0915015.1 3-dehydroquinate synthase [Psychrobacter sp. ANT_WB68]